MHWRQRPSLAWPCRDRHTALGQTRLAPAVAVLLVALAALSGCSSPIGSSTTSLSGHVLVVGSTALQPLVTQAAQLYQQQQPGVSVQVQGGGSLLGLQAVTSHQADIGDSDVYADPAQYPDPTSPITWSASYPSRWSSTPTLSSLLSRKSRS
jgi:ABC-type phosphate transport system substrate-binding protein